MPYLYSPLFERLNPYPCGGKDQALAEGSIFGGFEIRSSKRMIRVACCFPSLHDVDRQGSFLFLFQLNILNVRSPEERAGQSIPIRLLHSKTFYPTR